MGFGKKSAESFDSNKVYDLAAKAMRERRSSVVRLAFRLHLGSCLMNHFSNKAICQMLEKMVGISKPKEQKDLTKSYLDSHYRNINDDLVVPCRIIKAAIVEGAISTGKAVSKAELKRDLRVIGFTAPITLPKGVKSTTMDVRLVRNMTGVPDVRARALIPEGSTVDFVVQFPTTLSPDKVIAALEGAGQSIGIFDFRPEKGGDQGTFEVELLSEDKIDAIVQSCMAPEKPYLLPTELLQAYNSNLTENQEKMVKDLSDAEKKAKSLVEHVNGQGKTKRSQVEV
jgi:hypothetical protein